MSELRPRLDAALAGDGHVLFVDAAHFVFGTFLVPPLVDPCGCTSGPPRVGSG